MKKWTLNFVLTLSFLSFLSASAQAGSHEYLLMQMMKEKKLQQAMIAKAEVEARSHVVTAGMIADSKLSLPKK